MDGTSTQNFEVPEHLFSALNSGWTVVPGSFELHCYQDRWAGKLVLRSDTTTGQLVASFTVSDESYRFAAPQPLR
jgi:hypothetical protein